MKNIKLILFTFLITLSIQKSYSQNETFWSHVRFGGNIGIGFSNNSFSGVIAPSAIYDVNEKFSTGVGLNFGYTNGDNFTATNYGASLITLYNPFAQLQLSAEFEQMGVNRKLELEGGSFNENYWYPALFVGAGYRAGSISMGLKYDVLYDENRSIYASAYTPFVRIYF